MSDPRVRIAAVILDYGITCEYHEPDPQCSQCQDTARRLADDIAFALNAAQQPGRWVPWCAEHDALGLPCGKPGEELCAGGAVLRWVRAPVQPCRWHPQGAFVPDEGNTK